DAMSSNSAASASRSFSTGMQTPTSISLRIASDASGGGTRLTGPIEPSRRTSNASCRQAASRLSHHCSAATDRHELDALRHDDETPRIEDDGPRLERPRPELGMARPDEVAERPTGGRLRFAVHVGIPDRHGQTALAQDALEQ